MNTNTQRAAESRVRRLATRRGYRLCKSRVRNPHFNNQGGWQIAGRNGVAAGVRYELGLPEAEDFLREVLPDNAL